MPFPSSSCLAELREIPLDSLRAGEPCLARLKELGVGLGLSHQLTAVACGMVADGELKAIHVLRVELRAQADWSNEAVTCMAQSLTALHGLFIFNCGDKKLWGIYHQKRWFHSAWLEWDIAPLLWAEVGTLDELWAAWISQLGQFDIEEAETIDSQIEKNAAKERLAKRIEQLERKARKEIQPRKQWKYIEQLTELRKQYEQF